MNAKNHYQRLSRKAIRQDWLEDESTIIKRLLPLATLTPESASQVSRMTQRLVTVSRENQQSQGGLEAFLLEYDLSSQEGVMLMCLAEALIRIPDNATADQLIQDKLGSGEWSAHLGHSHSMFVNASTWGLMLTGQLVGLDQTTAKLKTLLNRLVNRSGEPLIRRILKRAMNIIARQFVLGHDISTAITRSQEKRNRQYLYSFDMLGEAAIDKSQADRYFEAYSNAIDALSEANPESGDTMALPAARPGISIKLSALHPRMEMSQRTRILDELIPRVINLCEQAMQANIGVTFDAEESYRLELLLDVFEAVFRNQKFSRWAGLGLAVQAYQKRAVAVIDWLITLAGEQEKMIMIRLVKGAYWDTEIKHAQTEGLKSYPVFTRKANTDLNYIACVQRIAQSYQYLYPQFATHNAQTVASVIEIMKDKGLYELQCLHGMAQSIYNALEPGPHRRYPLRIYSPVGSHKKLLPYLVRRLLENGANTSFLNRFADNKIEIAQLTTAPSDQVNTYAENQALQHPGIAIPPELYSPQRQNSEGINLNNPAVIEELQHQLESNNDIVKCGCLVDGKISGGAAELYFRPDNNSMQISEVMPATKELIQQAVDSAHNGFEQWTQEAIDVRAEALEKTADLIETQRNLFVRLLTSESGRCIADALNEIREAVDFCRYYATLAREQLTTPLTLDGPTGEINQLSQHGRGTFLCISPWNFPLAIFVGQVAAALVCGNSVIAKPARQTSATAFHAVKLFHEAGVPAQVLQLLMGSGEFIIDFLVQFGLPDGIAFTGSSQTACDIQRKMFGRHSMIIPMIAETGGQNCMIADSSSLSEQLALDVMHSAFNSAGQRCSALRILFIQEEIADDFLQLLCNAMHELHLGTTQHHQTDLGPIISPQAANTLEKYILQSMQDKELMLQLPVPINLQQGNFVPPCVFKCDIASLPIQEIFGPVLHVVPYSSNKLSEVIEQINSTGYGLTLGIHSRVQSTVEYIAEKVRVGNIYVNRNMIGAVVGVQPFGGLGLSGTGPKAGGPHYLQAFMVERTVTVNSAAIGGDSGLMSLD